MPMKRILIVLSAAMAIGGLRRDRRGGLVPGREPERPASPIVPRPAKPSSGISATADTPSGRSDHLLIFDYQEERDGQAPKARPAGLRSRTAGSILRRSRGSRSGSSPRTRTPTITTPVIFGWRKTVPDIAYLPRLEGVGRSRGPSCWPGPGPSCPGTAWRSPRSTPITRASPKWPG